MKTMARLMLVALAATTAVLAEASVADKGVAAHYFQFEVSTTGIGCATLVDYCCYTGYCCEPDTCKYVHYA